MPQQEDTQTGFGQSSSNPVKKEGPLPGRRTGSAPPSEGSEPSCPRSCTASSRANTKGRGRPRASRTHRRMDSPQSHEVTHTLAEDQDTCVSHTSLLNTSGLSSLSASRPKPPPFTVPTLGRSPGQGWGTELQQARRGSGLSRAASHTNCSRPLSKACVASTTGRGPNCPAVPVPFAPVPKTNCPENIYADSHSHTFAQVAPAAGDLAYSPLPTWVLSDLCERFLAGEDGLLFGQHACFV